MSSLDQLGFAERAATHRMVEVWQIETTRSVRTGRSTNKCRRPGKSTGTGSEGSGLTLQVEPNGGAGQERFPGHVGGGPVFGVHTEFRGSTKYWSRKG